MRTRTIGSLEVTVVGIGCNNFGGRIDEAATRSVVSAALDEGITLFDTADIYGGERSEELLGRALAGRRDEVVIATKFGMSVGSRTGGAAPQYVRDAAETSLRRLGTDHIDLLQLHTPDLSVPIGDTLAALAELVAEGKVREIGCSNFDSSQLTAADDAAASGGGPRFVSVQNEYSVLHREPEDSVLASCSELGVAFLPYFPLAKGLLTGKYRRAEPPPAGSRLAGFDDVRRERELSDERLRAVEGLDELAAASGRTLLDLAFGWLLARDVVSSVIAGATTPAQVRANAATADFVPDDALLAGIDVIAPR